MDLYAKYIDRFAEKYVKKDDAVFDCGCGDGCHTSILKRHSDNVVGGDFSNRTDPRYNINFIEIKKNAYGSDNQFNVVTSFDVIEHVENDLIFARELVKITKPGGLIIIGTPNRNRLSHKIRALIGRKVTYPYLLGYHFESGGYILHLREYTTNDLEDLSHRINDVEIISISGHFLGVYTPLGHLGFTNSNCRLLQNYSQHLFLVLRKIK